MILAIDFDGTYSADPVLWAGFAAIVKAAGHALILATSREPTMANEGELRAVIGWTLPIVWCGRQRKRAACKAAGYDVAIWIDDQPDTIDPPRPLWLDRLEGAWKWFVNG
jgi:hypothetical protein